MDIKYIENKWALVPKNIGENYSSIQLSNELRVRLLIALNKKNYRCIILSLINKERLDLISEYREYISIEYFDKTNHIVITLLDSRFNEQFNAFIYSVYTNIQPVKSNKEASNIFVNTYHTWREFFSPSPNGILSFESILGLFGELNYLKNKLDISLALDMEYILKSWVGPMGKTHDFEFNDLDVEVKTKEFSSSLITISSEYQLDSEESKLLILFVISVELNTHGGITIGQLARSIYNHLVERLVDTTIFLKALYKAGIPWSELDHYNNYLFVVKSAEGFNCKNPKFPRLIKSNIPNGVKKIKYKIDVNSLTEFIIPNLN